MHQPNDGWPTIRSFLLGKHHNFSPSPALMP